jgi:cytochrome c-type biogenesis protein CcmH/NrfG
MEMNKQAPAKSASAGWSPNQAYVLAAICLLVGIAVGYLLRGSEASAQKSENGLATQTVLPSSMPPGSSMGAQITPEQLKAMADKQVEPMLERLKTEPNNADLLASIGNAYYDAQQFRDAVAYYGRALKIQPGNTSVRTDMGTAYWYLGDPDRAIAEFKAVLKTEPTKANALFNLGIVQWQGKMDVKAAVATWQKLLDSNPNYENKAKVQELLTQAKQHPAIDPSRKTDKPAM